MRVVTEGRDSPNGTRIHGAVSVTLGPEDKVFCRTCSARVKVSELIQYPNYDWLVHVHKADGINGEIILWDRDS